eukprot:2865139-Prymnesium_polylepis.1
MLGPIGAAAPQFGRAPRPPPWPPTCPEGKCSTPVGNPRSPPRRRKGGGTCDRTCNRAGPRPRRKIPGTRRS